MLSAGIHSWHSEYFIRTMRLGKDEAVYKYLIEKVPELLEDEFFKPQSQAVLNIPIAAPKGAITRSEKAIELLERVKKFSQEWIKPGHLKGDNSHNVSATISIKPDEWEEVGEWMWNNREYYNGLSILPADLGTYKQAPYQEISKKKYEELSKYLKDIDFSEIFEYDDNTEQAGELACGGGKCELK